ncbi:unnamed protein product [Phytomonas sp. Hart1]|nr:unnamed protein product [Phytomonas sp. Hart1]|eukprot:CCW68515.1 unnamed protein product [Phytomonas sp. isolate Hart1]
MPWLEACLTSERADAFPSAPASRAGDPNAAVLCPSFEQTFLPGDFINDSAHGPEDSPEADDADRFRRAMARHIVVDDFVLFRLWCSVRRTARDEGRSRPHAGEKGDVSSPANPPSHPEQLRRLIRRILIQRYHTSRRTQGGVGLLTHATVLQSIGKD